MIATATPLGRSRGLLRRTRPAHPASDAIAAPLPPLDPRRQVIRAALLMVSGLSLCLVLQLLLISPLQQRAAQQRAYDSFRADLAAGTAPLSAAELDGELGGPVAYLEIPSIGLRQVVVEGTTGATLAAGPGHRRDTAMLGYSGTSVVMGRRSTYGSPFGRIDELEKGSIINVTTGAGVVDYRVRGVRRSGDPAPPPVESGSGRLVLATSEGSAFLPSGVLLVDADLLVPPLGAARPAVAAGALPPAERPMAIDTSTLWRLVLWLQVLLVVILGGVWAWHRWDPAKTWIAVTPPLLLVGLMAGGEVARLLPNLL